MSSEEVAPKEYIFGLVEPVPTAEVLGNYWRFLKSISETDRLLLGPIEIVLRSRAVARGWPVALKNHVMALSSESALSPKSAVVFVDISDVSTVTFFAAHLVLPLLTDGALARSPFARKMTHQEATLSLTKICEEIRTEWSAKLFFEQDPTKYPVDEIINLVTVLSAVRNVILQLQDTPQLWSPFQECSGLHIVNETESKGLSMIRRPDDELELSFRFARALPSNVADTMLALFNSVA
ncbi:MAG: hypothetical protein J0L82_01345 [Deltaproteobacteria bacterium]|nr:hypothetical protein [Deltaproteobacteria bacterium]